MLIVKWLKLTIYSTTVVYKSLELLMYDKHVSMVP